MAMERYQITVEPFTAGTNTDTLYNVSVWVDGEVISQSNTSINIPPHMAELEVISRMTQKIIQSLREKDENTSSR